MKYAILRAPHPNSRYDAALDVLSLAEAGVMLEKLGTGAKPELFVLNGLRLIAFESEPLEQSQIDKIARMSCLLALFAVESTTLTPLEFAPPVVCAKDMPSILKYKGKTNEVFTRFLLNMALFSSKQPLDGRLCVLDPMCGRGTTLFCAFGLGLDSFGIEADKKEVDEGAKFAKSYFEQERMKFTLEKSSLTLEKGRSAPLYSFISAPTAELFRSGATTRLEMACGDAKDCAKLTGRRSFDAIVTDLPYGVAHGNTQSRRGSETLRQLEDMLPLWVKKLKRGGCAAFSFNTYATTQAQIRRACEKAGLTPREGGYYDGLEHRVEQAINRDIAVARLD